MRYCKSCFSQLGDAYVFCGECGEKVPPEPGLVDGKHYTEHVDTVKTLMRANDLQEAESLLKRLVEATEAEANAEQFGVSPWYYEQLAVIFRKRKDVVAEIEILKRFGRQMHAPGAMPAALLKRLSDLKASQGPTT